MAKDKKKKKKVSKKPKEKMSDVALDDALRTSKKKATIVPLDQSLKTTKTEQPELSFDAALKSAEKTQSDLQGLLSGISEGPFYQREIKEEEKFEPQLAHESKGKVAGDYLMEDIPITERKKAKGRPPAKKKAATVAKIEAPRESIYVKLRLFLEGVFKGYNERYDRWENSISQILAILRKMRKFTKKNTEELIITINNLFDKIRSNLDQFKLKRDEIEKLSGVDIEVMSGQFRKVLGLLELQVKEYQLKKFTDELIHKQQLLQ